MDVRRCRNGSAACCPEAEASSSVSATPFRAQCAACAAGTRGEALAGGLGPGSLLPGVPPSDKTAGTAVGSDLGQDVDRLPGVDDQSASLATSADCCVHDVWYVGRLGLGLVDDGRRVLDVPPARSQILHSCSSRTMASNSSLAKARADRLSA